MRITLDLDRLTAEGRLTAEEAARLTALASPAEKDARRPAPGPGGRTLANWQKARRPPPAKT